MGKREFSKVDPEDGTPQLRDSVRKPIRLSSSRDLIYLPVREEGPFYEEERQGNIIHSVTEYDPNDTLLTSLNKNQRLAVTLSPSSVLQILAGPGTGKTTTLCHRAAWLIKHHNVLPQDIIIVTFTNQAAKELSSRVNIILHGGNGPSIGIVSGTFHGVCVKYLKMHGDLIDIPRTFMIHDDAAQTKTLQNILKSPEIIAKGKAFGYNPIGDKAVRFSATNTSPGVIDVKVTREIIDKIKSDCMTIEEWLETPPAKRMPFLSEVLEAYDKKLKATDQLDFNDLLLYAVKLFKKHPALLANIKHVFIDEYQDTDYTQYQLMLQFAQNDKPITIVGDPDQSIYSFRHAQPLNFYRMRVQYPDYERVYLTTNYRSPEGIIDLSMKVIQYDNTRIDSDRQLQSHYEGPAPIGPRRIAFSSTYREAGAIALYIKGMIAMYGHVFRYSDVAILLRFRFLMKSVELALTEHGIPYNLKGSRSFWELREVKIATNFLCAIHSNFLEDATLDILSILKCKLGEKTLNKLVELDAPGCQTFFDKLEKIAKKKFSTKTVRLNKDSRAAISKYVDFIGQCRAILRSKPYPDCLDEVFTMICGEYNIFSLIDENMSENEIDSRTRNLSVLRDRLVSLQEDMEVDNMDASNIPVTGVDYLATFLQRTTLGHIETEAGSAEGDPTNRVTLSTIHGSKGLEWPVVFLPCLGETGIRENPDEECRIFYVSVTRSASLCLMTETSGEQRRSKKNYNSFIGSTPLDGRLPSLTDDTVSKIATFLGRAELLRNDPRKELVKTEDGKILPNASLQFLSGKALLEQVQPSSDFATSSSKSVKRPPSESKPSKAIKSDTVQTTLSFDSASQVTLCTIKKYPSTTSQKSADSNATVEPASSRVYIKKECQDSPVIQNVTMPHKPKRRKRFAPNSAEDTPAAKAPQRFAPGSRNRESSNN